MARIKINPAESFLMLSLELAFAIVPGLILFLYGIEHFSREIQRIAGEKFRSLLSKVTETRAGGALLGAAVTATIQSSTATTVIVVGLVGAGIIPFMQSVGIIIGANVGTTVTGQLVALKLTAFAPFFILLGFLLSIFGREYKVLGKPIFYFGLVFFGLTLISEGIEPVKNDPAIVEIFSSLSDIFIALAAGILFTIIMQSSSVTTGIVVLLVGSGLLSIYQGIPLIMGANIGTTLTSMLASLNMDLFARRAAVAHFLFNIGGVVIFLPFLAMFADIVIDFGGTPAQQMANAHTLFNVIAAVIFLVALKPFVSAVEYLVPGKEREIIFRTKYLGDRLPASNKEAFRLIEKELGHSMEITVDMFRHSLYALKDGSNIYMKVEKLESFNDFLDDKISDALITMSPRKLSKKEAAKTLLLVRMSNAVEQLGDLAKSLAFLREKMEDSRLHFTETALADLEQIHGQFEKNLIIVAGHVPRITDSERKSLRQNDVLLRKLITTEYEDHMIQLLKSREAYAGATFVDAISIIETSNAKVREIRKLSEEYAVL